jgi:hypothetical protein
MARLLLTFEQERYLTRKCQKGLGRKKGKKFAPRKQYKAVKKGGELEEILKTRPRQE